MLSLLRLLSKLSPVNCDQLILTIWRFISITNVLKVIFKKHPGFLRIPGIKKIIVCREVQNPQKLDALNILLTFLIDAKFNNEIFFMIWDLSNVMFSSYLFDKKSLNYWLNQHSIDIKRISSLVHNTVDKPLFSRCKRSQIDPKFQHKCEQQKRHKNS